MKAIIMEECVARLQILMEQGLYDPKTCIQDFKKGMLYVSEENLVLGMPVGVVFSLEEKPQYAKVVAQIPLSLEITPYFIMMQKTSHGLIASVLYVSNDPDEWEEEREDLENNRPYAFVCDMQNEFFEVGTIFFEMAQGGPVRRG